MRRTKAKPAPASSATETAYRVIKEEILSNDLHPGDPVSPERYIRQLDLSRTPVREALLRLEREGLIEVRPRMGTFVAPLDLRRIQEMYRVRRLLEAEAAREAAARAPEVEVRALAEDLRALPNDPALLSERGQQVHALIVAHCGNEVLSGMILSLQDHFRRFRSLSVEIPRKVLASHEEHLAILDALLRRDGDAAAGRVREHFDHAAQSLVENLLNGSAPASRVTIGVR